MTRKRPLAERRSMFDFVVITEEDDQVERVTDPYGNPLEFFVIKAEGRLTYCQWCEQEVQLEKTLNWRGLPFDTDECRALWLEARRES